METRINYQPSLPGKGILYGEHMPAEGYNQARRFYRFCKRGIDLCMSLLVIVFILSWLLPVLALCILVDSGGPVFFVQKRVGRNGSVFTCFKLRTMVINREADDRPAEEYDGRITRVGFWLRKSNLDELPQFLNVLLGSMSMVGPRPHMIRDCRYHASVVPGYDLRNCVRPGITGLAQVKGFHGPIKDIGNIQGRYQWDLFYIRHAGFLLDLHILRKTIAGFFLRAGHYIFTRKYADKNTMPLVGARAPGDKDLYQ